MGDSGGFGPEDGRIRRRALLRNAAIVGGVAWTAPLVIESLATPAGALTLSGCYRFTINATSSGCANAPILSSIGTCAPGAPAGCSSVTDVTSGSINTYCLTVTQGDEGNNDDCQPEFLQVDDTIVFGINSGLGACQCTNATIEAAAGLFSFGIGTTCYQSATSSQVTIDGTKKSVTFGNPGIGQWTRYSFVVKCS